MAKETTILDIRFGQRPPLGMARASGKSAVGWDSVGLGRTGSDCRTPGRVRRDGFLSVHEKAGDFGVALKPGIEPGQELAWEAADGFCTLHIIQALQKELCGT